MNNPWREKLIGNIYNGTKSTNHNPQTELFIHVQSDLCLSDFEITCMITP